MFLPVEVTTRKPGRTSASEATARAGSATWATVILAETVATCTGEAVETGTATAPQRQIAKSAIAHS